MCSISGWISSAPLSKHYARRLSQALIWYGASRGEQSAGIYLPGRLLKKATHPHAFVESPEFYGLFGAPASMMLGHTRAPTCGDRGDKQAHPFQHEQTIGVHNGMFWDAKHVREKFDLSKDSGVDSELAVSYAAKYGILKLPEFLEQVDGPAALGIITPFEGTPTLFLLRHGNPTSYCELVLRDGTTLLIFASTPAILKPSVQYVWMIEDVPIKETKEGILYIATSTGLVEKSPRLNRPKPWRLLGGRQDFDEQAWFAGATTPHSTSCVCNVCQHDRWKDLRCTCKSCNIARTHTHRCQCQNCKTLMRHLDPKTRPA